MMKLLILNGPNLNLLGKREVDIYGKQTFTDYFRTLEMRFPKLDLHYFQSNSEGDLIDKIHEVGFHFDGIVLNGGAYTHTSLAIADAIAAVTTPVVEVHISNIHARETFRHHSYSAANCVGSIIGLGLEGYALALQFLAERPKK
jgi:3-dehydroquinate dehydratase-2